MRISVDGTEVFNGNNHTQQTVTIGHEPCAEYSVPNSRTQCRTGHRLENRPRYRTRQRWFIRRSGRITEQGVVYSEWQSTPFTVLQPAVPCTGHVCRGYDAQTQETENNYFCVPEANCQGAPITELQLGNTGNYQHRFSVDIERTQAEQDAIDLAAEQAAQRPATTPAPTPTPAPTEIEEEIQELAEAIEENTRVAEELLNRESDDGRILQPVETTENTKYRLITPLEYEWVNGKIVPRIRYESVRYLSPDNVASFVSRGYTVESVNPDTPISNSKPYGKTLIERAQVLTPPSIKTRDIFNRSRKSGQQIIAERQGRNYTPTPYKAEARRVVR